MLNIAVCDDIPLHLENVRTRMQQIIRGNQEACELSAFSSSGELWQRIEEGWYPQIAVLDIEMDGENGIQLAKKMNEKLPDCRIIFFTSYINYAPEVYETQHIWFVIKSRADEFFEQAMQKALESLTEDTATIPGIMIREKGSQILVPVRDILYIGKVGRKAHVHCTNRDYYDTRRPTQLIPESQSDRFLRCHQGYWVNIRMINELDHEEFVLQGGTRIPISRTYRNAARKAFFERYHL